MSFRLQFLFELQAVPDPVSKPRKKIVVKVEMKCDKCRSKALKIVASSYGVEEVKLEGKDKDRVVVIGEGVDSIGLAKSLRKKVGPAHILTLHEVKPKSTSEQQQKSSSNLTYSESLDQPFQYHYPQLVGYQVVYDPTPAYCSLM